MQRTLKNCGLIKSIGIRPRQFDGKCEGFQCGEEDDEPAESCKKCKLCTAYEENNNV